jgi:sugar (pentulose or hexulose) kinase
MRFLGIDAGATYLKGAVLDAENLRVERVVRTPFPAFLGGAGGIRETLPAEILDRVAGLLDELYAAAPDARGLLLCGQMHGMVLATGEGAALSNFISWQDARAAEPMPGAGGSYFAALASRIEARVRQEAGNELRPGLPVSALFVLKERGELPAPPFLPAALADFLAAHLCHARPVTSAGNAAAHGCMHVRRGEWHRELLAAAGLEAIDLPAIVPEGTCVGTLPRRWGRIPCYVAVGDQQAALLGASLEPGELSLNVATGSQVSLLAGDAAAGDYQVRPYFGGQFLRTITHIPAGRSLNLLLRLLAEMGTGGCGDELWERLETAARAVPATSLEVDLSFFAGALGEAGGITNIREDNFTAGHLFRAAIETMAGNYRHCAARLSPAGEWRRLVFSGGLILKLRTLREAAIRRFGCAFRLADEAEDTLLGLARLAAQCTVGPPCAAGLPRASTTPCPLGPHCTSTLPRASTPPCPLGPPCAAGLPRASTAPCPLAPHCTSTLPRASTPPCPLGPPCAAGLPRASTTPCPLEPPCAPPAELLEASR